MRGVALGVLILWSIVAIREGISASSVFMTMVCLAVMQMCKMKAASLLRRPTESEQLAPYNFENGESRVWQLIIEGLPKQDAHVKYYEAQMAANGWPEARRGEIITLTGLDPNTSLAQVNFNQMARIREMQGYVRYQLTEADEEYLSTPHASCTITSS